MDCTSPNQPIGVFDSGVGGLSILKALRAELPHEDFVYVADNAYAPYGEREESFVIERSRSIAHQLFENDQIKSLVVACNTATALAIHVLRQDYPGLPIIGVEPALKPALSVSKTKRIGVIATRATLNSHKFKALLNSMAGQAYFVCQPCDGLADAIERSDKPKTIALCAFYTGEFNLQEIDTLVLGCTHYPFAIEHFVQLLGPAIHLVSNGEPVARQTRRRLNKTSPKTTHGEIVLQSTGDNSNLRQSAQRWLGI